MPLFILQLLLEHFEKTSHSLLINCCTYYAQVLLRTCLTPSVGRREEGEEKRRRRGGGGEEEAEKEEEDEKRLSQMGLKTSFACA